MRCLISKEARVGQIILPGILPVFGTRSHGYRNSRRMAVNGVMKQLCREEEVGFVDLWDSFVRKEDMYSRDCLHLSVKGAFKEAIPAYEVQLPEEAECNEAIWCKLVTGHKTVTIGVLCRCPNITKQNNEIVQSISAQNHLT